MNPAGIATFSATAITASIKQTLRTICEPQRSDLRNRIAEVDLVTARIKPARAFV